MAQRSFEAYKLWKDAQLKYDYYIIGLIAAIFTYSISKYSPQKIAFSDNSFELLAIMFLFVSLYLGIKRLEIDLAIQSISLKQTEVKELLREARKIQIAGGSHDLDNGGIITSEDAQKKIDECSSIMPRLETEFSQKSKLSSAYFTYRNKFMIAGFSVLVLAKCIGVYSI